MTESSEQRELSLVGKLMAMMSHRTITLPVAALLKQYKENVNPLIRHFNLLYIQQGIDRLTVTDRLDLLPSLITGLQTDYASSVSNAASLFHLLLRILHSLTFPVRGDNEDVELRSKLGLGKSSKDSAFVALWLGKLLLLTLGLPENTRCPGLSTEDVNFLCLNGKKDIWVPNAGGLNLVETKVRAAKFLASGAFVDMERFLPAIFASSDPNSRLSDIGDDILKRADPAVSLEDSDFLKSLFEIYLGTRGVNGSLPARAPLQIKILGLLCKSKQVANFISQSIQIIKEGLVPGEDDNPPGRNQPIKQGLEASKLRDHIFIFTNWLARISSPTQLQSVAPTLVSQLRSYIEGQGWPKYSRVGTSNTGELASRGYGYESIGLLAAACPESLLLKPDLDLLRWLFDSLGCDSSGQEISFSIDKALSSVMGAFGTNLSPDVEVALTDLLVNQMGLRIGEVQSSSCRIIRSTRFTSVRFANRCLPFHSTKARWIDVLAIGDDSEGRNEISEEGRRGLDPYWQENSSLLTRNKSLGDGQDRHNLQRFPDFQDLVAEYYGSISDLDASTAYIQRIPSSKAYDAASLFCRNILIHQALDSSGSTPTIDTDWERKLGALIENNADARQRLRKYLVSMADASLSSVSPLQLFLQSLFVGVAERVEDNVGRSAECLLELCALSPNDALSVFAPKATLLRQAIVFSSNPSLRAAASNIFGILASHPDSSQSSVRKTLEDFQQKISTWNVAVGVQIYHTHGAILATSFLISRLSQRRASLKDYREFIDGFLKAILDITCESRDGTLVEGAISALSDVAAYGVITLKSLPKPHSLASIVSKLKAKATGGDEKAILALGDLSMLCEEDDEESYLDQIIDVLYSLHETRQPEVQFAVGSALSFVAVGWSSEVSIGRLDVEGLPCSMPRRQKTLSGMIDKILKDCRTTRPSLRQASVIWLLCLVQYCGHRQDIITRLRECQVAFKGFLADHDSLNRESAARGLTFVYEKGDKTIKDELVRDLVASFTGTTTGLAGSVSDQTQLFEPGALPTGDNQSITTYKDIMSLAAEVGDPSLVYRFMSMASSNAIWSSRATFGHFGLSKILSDSSVDGYLAQNPRLYQVLFRYRFDPNTNVRASMNDIWKVLVKDSSAVTEKFFESIMDDLLKNILGKEWRVRQACCAAIADLIQGRSLEKYEKYLNQIWTLTFKVCDDIKASVREAAQALARVLAGILTRSLEAGESSTQNIDAMLKIVVPFLFSPSGLESGSKEVQVFSLSTILDIIKSSNSKTLRPFIPDLVRQLIALLSVFENEGINYLHLNADKYGVTTQQIDDARLSGIKASPLMEAIERCLDALDEPTMATLRASLEDAIKTAVGLPSKVGASRVLVSLSTRNNFIFKTHADHFLRLARKQLLDRNDTIASAWASACGYLARLATDGEIIKLISYCRELYFDSDNDRHRVIAGDVVHAVSKYATDRFNALATEVLPLVFIAKHDQHEPAQALFKNTWNENVGGSRTVLLYLKEITDLSSKHLESPRWSIKHTSAFAIAECINSLGAEISDRDASIIWPALEKAIAGKTWEGKEKVLRALVMFARSSKLITSSPKAGEQIEKIVIRESKRNNIIYRQEALASLADFVDLREDHDMYPQVLEITEPIIRAYADESSGMDVDSPSGGQSSSKLVEVTLANALSALLRSINPKLRQDEGKERKVRELKDTTDMMVSDLSSALARALELTKSATKEDGSSLVQDTIYDTEVKLFGKMANIRMNNRLEETMVGYANNLSPSRDLVERSRQKASEAMTKMVPLARYSERIRSALSQAIANARLNERSGAIQQRLERAQESLVE
ncbi:MAG: hypothetical protein Q9195_001780 [Heterodermia aff. obscurata]